MIIRFRDYKVNESKEQGEILIASNSSRYHWEYDTRIKDAKLYYNAKDDSYRLNISETHTKTGIGKGTTTKELYSKVISKGGKADLKMVASALKEHNFGSSRSCESFKKSWVDEQTSDGTLKPLSEIIAGNRHIKTSKLIKSFDAEEAATAKTSNDEKPKYDRTTKTMKLALIHRKLGKLSDDEIEKLYNKLNEGKKPFTMEDGEEIEFVFVYSDGKKKKEENIKIKKSDKCKTEADCKSSAIEQFKKKHGSKVKFEVMDI